MLKIHLFLLLALVFCFGACASHPKSESHLYAGDGPTIHYAPSRAGGQFESQ